MQPLITKTIIDRIKYQEVNTAGFQESASSDYFNSGDPYDIIRKARDLYFNRDRMLPFQEY